MSFLYACAQLENGVSPLSCGIMECSNKFIESHIYFQHLKSEYFEEERKKAEKKAKKPNARGRR